MDFFPMIQMTLAQAAALLGTPSPTMDKPFRGLSIDTRTIEPGNLFVAIKGERVDSHDLLAEAYQKGAAAALVMRAGDSPLPQIQVKDTVIAMAQLASAWRQQHTLPVIAVTGSNGKTTLKNMIASILTAACQGILQVLA